MKTVVIYRRALLPISETFVLAQAGGLERFKPQFVALQAAKPTLEVPAGAIYLSPNRTSLSRVRKALYDFTGIAPRFHERVRRSGPALIHAHFGTDGVSSLPLANRLGVPLVVSLHGYDVATSDSHWKKSILGRQYLAGRPALWKRATTFICVSEFIRDIALKAGFPEDKLRVHYIGIDRSRFVPERRPREHLAVFVGRLVPMKGCSFLLRAMRLVQDSDPAAKLVVIGDGPLRSELQAIAKDLRLNCEFLGPQPSQVVREWMQRARMLCVPSVTAPNGEREALGIVVLEAQAVGTPVVGFRTGGIPEAVVDRETGLLAKPEDVEELATYIRRYLADDALWEASSANAIDWVGKRFDLAAQNRLLEDIYQEATEA